MDESLPDLTSFDDFPAQALVRAGYVSRAMQVFNESDLEDIRESSQRNNTSLSIGGVLLINDDKVFQILEGSAQSVKILLEKIKADSRHHSLKIFAITPVDEKAFEDWSMTVCNLTYDTVARRDAFNVAFGVFERAGIPLALNNQRVEFFRNLAISMK